MTDDAASGETAAVQEEQAATPQVEIRGAVHADALILKLLLKQSRSEIREAQFSQINEQKLRAYIDLCIGEGCCLVAVLDGAIIGSLCLRTLQELWSDDQFLNEEWFYVYPRFRDTGAADKLRVTAEQLADQMNLPVYMAINNDDPQRIEAWLDQKGYRRTGANFIRYPRDGKQEVIDDDKT